MIDIDNGVDSLNADRMRILIDTPTDHWKTDRAVAYSQASTQNLKLTNWLLVLTKTPE